MSSRLNCLTFMECQAWPEIAFSASHQKFSNSLLTLYMVKSPSMRFLGDGEQALPGSAAIFNGLSSLLD